MFSNSLKTNKFYYDQNQQLRKQIREIDMKIAQGDSVSQQCIFLVVGPLKSGKTSLLKTLQFALNGSIGLGAIIKNQIASYQIKKGSRWQVQGVKQLKQIPKKYTIQGLQILSQDKPCIRYKKALQFVNTGFGGCMQQRIQQYNKGTARVCLFCFDLSAEIDGQQLIILKFLKSDLKQKGVKVLIILRSQLDRNSDDWKLAEQAVINIQREFQISDRDDIIFFNGYKFEQETSKNSMNKISLSKISPRQLQNDQEINFYALQLLLRISREFDKATRGYGKMDRVKSFLCGWT